MNGWRCGNDDGFYLFHAARTMADNSGAKRWEEGLMWTPLSVLSVFPGCVEKFLILWLFLCLL